MDTKNNKNIFFIAGGVGLILFVFYRWGKSKSNTIRAAVDTSWLDPAIDFKALAKRAFDLFEGFWQNATDKNQVVQKINALNDEGIKHVYNLYGKLSKKSFVQDLEGEINIGRLSSYYKELLNRYERLGLT